MHCASSAAVVLSLDLQSVRFLASAVTSAWQPGSKLAVAWQAAKLAFSAVKFLLQSRRLLLASLYCESSSVAFWRHLTRSELAVVSLAVAVFRLEVVVFSLSLHPCHPLEQDGRLVYLHCFRSPAQVAFAVLHLVSVVLVVASCRRRARKGAHRPRRRSSHDSRSRAALPADPCCTNKMRAAASLVVAPLAPPTHRQLERGRGRVARLVASCALPRLECAGVERGGNFAQGGVAGPVRRACGGQLQQALGAREVRRRCQLPCAPGAGRWRARRRCEGRGGHERAATVGASRAHPGAGTRKWPAGAEPFSRARGDFQGAPGGITAPPRRGRAARAPAAIHVGRMSPCPPFPPPQTPNPHERGSCSPRHAHHVARRHSSARLSRPRAIRALCWVGS